MNIFFSLACFCAFGNAAHSRLRCRDAKLSLLGLLRMPDLALSQSYTRVFDFWKSIKFDSAWFGDCRPCQFFSPACFRAFSEAAHAFLIENPKLCLPDVLKMLVLALPQIYTPLFHSWKAIDLDSAWVGDSRPCQFSFLTRVLTRLAMPHTRVFGFRIQNYPYWAF